MTGQDLLDRMELLNQELQLQSGEPDVTRGLLALNVAQDYFESLAAVRKDILGSAVGTVSTSSSTETTAFPSGVLRIDRLQRLNGSTIEQELTRVHRTGGHRGSGAWPLYVINSTASGKPSRYWTNGTNIYWDPLPDSAYTIRYYGFSTASDISAAGTFAYPDIVALPLASFAVRLIKSGLDDSAMDVASLALETFKSTLDTLANFNRDGAQPLEYTSTHTE